MALKGLNSESTDDWETNPWQVPVNLLMAQMLKVGPQINRVAVGARYGAAAPDSGQVGWGWRLQLMRLFPK